MYLAVTHNAAFYLHLSSCDMIDIIALVLQPCLFLAAKKENLQ